VRVDPDSSVGIANRFGLDDPGIESRWGEIFRTRPDGSCGPPILHTIGTGYFQGVKRPGRGLDHPHTSSAEFKERAELYPYSPFGPSWPCLGWHLPFPLPLENGWYYAWKFYLIVTVLLITRCPVSINYKHFSGSHYEQKTESVVIDIWEEKSKLILHANKIRNKFSKLIMDYEMVEDFKDNFWKIVICQK
jgi:hypothetical protein